MLWDNIDIHLVRLVKYAQSASLGQIAGAVLVALIIASALTGDDKRNIPNIPTYYVSRLEPALLSHFKFVIDARSIISNGCRKVHYLGSKSPLCPIPTQDAEYPTVQKLAVHNTSF